MASIQPKIHSASLDPNNLESLKQAYHRDGFVILDNLFVDYDKDELSRLRDATQQVIRATREGHWKDRRVVGNPFPPFDKENLDSWGVQNLLHPSIPYSRDSQPSSSASTSSNPFLAFYSSSPLLEISSTLLSLNSISSMQLELFNLLIEPSQHAFALAWHRDDIKPNVDQEEESKRLKAPDNGVQWNVALQDDDCLFVIPATHKRLRSQEEIKANQMKAPEAVLIKNGEEIGFDGSWEEDPKTTLKVRLKAGQAVFYSQRILHRASYLPSRKRATLHGCFGAADPMNRVGAEDLSEEQREELEIAGRERARNILQHNVSWMRDPSFGRNLPERLKPMYENLMKMDEKWRGKEKELGYSQ